MKDDNDIVKQYYQYSMVIWRIRYDWYDGSRRIPALCIMTSLSSEW